MKHHPIVFFSIILFTVFAIQCSQNSGPTSPGMPTMSQAGDATLTGSVTASGANSVDFSQVEIGIEGTSLNTQPDQNGNFHLAGVPSGNITVEVNVQNTISDLGIENVQSREEIKAQIEINDANEAQFCHLERNRKAESELQLEIRPKKWNVDWENSPDEDTACFRIYGDGVEDIDPESIIMTCVESGLSLPPPDYTWELGGVYLKIFITQKAAIALVPDAERGDVRNFEVVFEVDGTAIDPPLTDKISIVGPKPENGEAGPLTVKISPNKWNTSWTKTNGQVTIQIKGEGFDKIISSTFELACTDSGFELLSDQFRFILGGSHFTAKCSKQDALALIDNPVPGMRCEIVVFAELEGSGDPLSETLTIEIVGKKEKD